MSAGARIGPAGPGDAPDMAALHGACFPRGWSVEEIAALASSPGAHAFAARSTGALAGFILGRVAADEAEVLTLAVAPESRRAGLGAALLAALEDSCRAAGARRIFLEAAETNAAALALYRRAAYAPLGRRPAYYESGAAALTLGKDL